MAAAETLRALALPAIDLLFPPRCPLCGTRLSTQDGLCAACWSTLAIPGEPACGFCARPFDGAVPHGSTCAACMAQPPRHDGIAAATLYNDASRALVLQLKHGRRLGLAPMMARLIAQKLPGEDVRGGGVRGEGERLLVPVPLHWSRLWHRGYNQAAVLAAALGRESGHRLLVDALVRRKRTPPLGGQGKAARARLLSGAITVRESRKPLLKGASVILVDDVLTSGATASACVSALKRAGASSVAIACFARVLDEALEHT